MAKPMSVPLEQHSGTGHITASGAPNITATEWDGTRFHCHFRQHCTIDHPHKTLGPNIPAPLLRARAPTAAQPDQRHTGPVVCNREHQYRALRAAQVGRLDTSVYLSMQHAGSSSGAVQPARQNPQRHRNPFPE
eukprot:1790102-Rhodomonas_salina.14